ncbi:aldehyde dehydrogenase [Actinomadura sp. NBRC 104412]|uniref:aldehyde dehydrogenase family protein n=1 Tax=Actinomadura sp. NBRC 104412 TaxID=3032203 RepID=UPI0024A08149|nr:aldehyde dehydrogenase family protein [Actinomadura sp. NBRC 104412]GLZ07498.1 aldehyde dehydrogenase [Actinomadura sp. NBRC 104412]
MTTIVRNRSADEFFRRNPADTDDVMGPYPKATGERIDATIDAAARAQRAWAAVPAPARGDLILRAGALLRRRAGTIAATLTREEGKTLAEAKAEVEYASAVLEFIGGAGRWRVGDAAESAQPGTFVYTWREPLGVVAAITPWNFPVSIPAIKIASALVAGNAVVWKPALYTPASSLALAECLRDAGLPDGVLGLVFGEAAAGGQIASDSRVRAVSFTGSTAVGRTLAGRLAERGARAQLELGGKNAVVVLADADIDRAARETALAAFQSAGQKCTAASRVIVVPEVRAAFVEALVAHTERLTVGAPTGPATVVGPLVHESAVERQLTEITRATAAGARVLSGGERPDGDLARGHYLMPTVLDRVAPDSPLARTELFGPVLGVFGADDLDDALRIVNGTDYGLAAAVYTRDLTSAFAFAAGCAAGKVKINSSPTGGDLHVPFGGWKDSGAGPKELGRSAVDFFSEEKTVYVNHAGGPA